MKQTTDYNNYDPETSDDKFYDTYPTTSEIKDYVIELQKHRKHIECATPNLSEWDTHLGYGQIKRNISYLNNQIQNGVLIYYDTKLVLYDAITEKVISDEIVQTGNGKQWKLSDGNINAVLHQSFYWEQGKDVRIICFGMELYFIPKIIRIGEKKGMLDYRERVFEKTFKEIVNFNNVFDKINMQNLDK